MNEDDYFVSAIDGHDHYGEQAKRDCAVCMVEAERDELRSALAEVYFWLGPPQPALEDHTEVPGLVQKAMAEKDRLQEALDRDPLRKRTHADIVALEDERDELQVALQLASAALVVFASVIKSGEPWTPVCDEMLRKALDHRRAAT